jgi:hypothetical protein
MDTITKGDFLQMVKMNHLEVLTQEQLSKNTTILKSYMEKALTSELSEVEKGESNAMIDDIGSLDAWCVLRDDFTKAIVYTRREQIAWDEPERGEFGEILKARGGVYKLTAENKKLGRVGQKYGESKEEESPSQKMFNHTKELQNPHGDVEKHPNPPASQADVDKFRGGKMKLTGKITTSERDYLFQVVNYSKHHNSLDDIDETEVTGEHAEQIKKVLDKLPEVDFKKDFTQEDLPAKLKGGVFIAKHKGKRYLVDTQGFDYPRYVTQLK